MAKVSIIEDYSDVLPLVAELLPLPKPEVTVEDDRSFIQAVRGIESVKDRSKLGLAIRVLYPRYMPWLTSVICGERLTTTVNLEPINVLEQLTGLAIRRDKYTDDDVLEMQMLNPDISHLAKQLSEHGEVSDEPFVQLALLNAVRDLNVIDRDLSPEARLLKLVMHLPRIRDKESTLLATLTLGYVAQLAELCSINAAKQLAEQVTLAIQEDKTEELLQSQFVHYLLRGYVKLARDKVCQVVLGSDKWTVAELEGFLTMMQGAFGVVEQVVPEALWAKVDQALAVIFPDVVESAAPKQGPIDTVHIMLNKVSGCFVAEYRYLLEKLIGQSEPIDWEPLRFLANRVSRKFGPLVSKQPKLGQEIELLERMLYAKAVLARPRPSRASSFNQWARYYQEEQLPLDDIDASIKEHKSFVLFMNEFAEALRDEIAAARVEANLEYAEWLSRSFPDVLKQQYKHLPKSVMSVPDLIKKLAIGDQRVVLWVIDAMCWDHWEVLQELLYQRGLSLKQPASSLLSMLPSSTLISRRALFGGKTLANLLVQHQQTKISPHNEALTLGRALGLDISKAKTETLDAVSLVDDGDGRRITRIGNDLIYVLGGPEDFTQVLAVKPKITALVTSDVDGMWHNVTGGIATVRKSVRHILEEIVNAIEPWITDDVQLVIATDHGTVSAYWSTSTGLPAHAAERRAAYIDNVEVHPRYAVVLADGYHATGIVPTDDQVLLIGGTKALAEFGLPTTQRPKYKTGPTGVEYYAIPKTLSYMGNHGVYMHGGLSYYETIVPYAVLSKVEAKVKAPQIAISGDVKAKQVSNALVQVCNKTDTILRGVRITVSEAGLSGLLLGDMDTGSCKEINIPMSFADVGTAKVQLTLEYIQAGMRQAATIENSVEVKSGISASVSRLALRKER